MAQSILIVVHTPSILKKHPQLFGDGTNLIECVEAYRCAHRAVHVCTYVMPLGVVAVCGSYALVCIRTPAQPWE